MSARSNSIKGWGFDLQRLWAAAAALFFLPATRVHQKKPPPWRGRCISPGAQQGPVSSPHWRGFLSFYGGALGSMARHRIHSLLGAFGPKFLNGFLELALNIAQSPKLR